MEITTMTASAPAATRPAFRVRVGCPQVASSHAAAQAANRGTTGFTGIAKLGYLPTITTMTTMDVASLRPGRAPV